MSEENCIVEVLNKRRSIRKFTPTAVETDKVDQLIKAALLSPSSRNRRPCEFIIVTDRELLEKLSEAKPHGAAFLKNAPLGIVVVGNEETSDVWVEDAAIASMNMQLAAETMGLGSCWIQIRKRDHSGETTSEEYVQKLLGIPENIHVLSMIAIGYPEQSRPPYTDDDLNHNKIHNNRY